MSASEKRPRKLPHPAQARGDPLATFADPRYFSLELAGNLLAHRYRIVRQIAAGGMGAVCEAIHEGTARRVALKVIRDTALLGEDRGVWLERFRREARTVGALHTPHIIQVFDAGTDEDSGQSFIAMELLDGRDLAVLLKEQGPLPAEAALKVVAQACLGLERAHEVGIVHRDIKPGNVFLSESKSGSIIVKVVDFGIAKVVSEELTGPEHAELTQTGSLLGTPTYMSPEQAKGAKNIDFRADLWALAVVLYKALSGKVPHPKRGGLGELIVEICTEPAPSIQAHARWVRPEIARILDKALQLEIDRRYQSAAEFRADLEAIVGSDITLNREALRPLTDDEVDCVAARYTSAFPPPAVIPDVDRRSAEVSRTEPGLTRGGTLEAPRARLGRKSVVALRVVAFAAVGGGLALLAWGRGAGPTASPSVAPEPTSAAPAAPAAPLARTVRLEIEPPDAIVTVDGSPATVSSGTVELHGPLGSTHDVEVKQGSHQSRARVAITESGAVPARVALGAATQPATAARPGGRPLREPARASPGPSGREKPPSAQPAGTQPTAKPGVGLITDFE